MKKYSKEKFLRRTMLIFFWIILWQIISVAVSSEILIASPIAVLKAIWNLIFEFEFWKSIIYSFTKIIGGFFLGASFAVILAIVSCYSKLIKEAIDIPMAIIKSTPVASFIIIALIWINSENLSVFISFLMVLPVIYTNVYKGIEEVDEKMKEMMRVFKVSLRKRYKYLYIPSVMPFLKSALAVSLGLCWKAGIAAEVIGIPSGSIGERLYEAKIYLNTSDLFAWTIMIIIISTSFEKLFLSVISFIEEKAFGGGTSEN